MARDGVEPGVSGEQGSGSDVGRGKSDDGYRVALSATLGATRDVLLQSADAVKRSPGLEVGDSAGRPASMARTRWSKARPARRRGT